MKILADAHIPYLKGVAEQFGEVEYLPGNQFTQKAIKNKDALIVRTVTHFGEDILSGTNVKLICSATIGYDHIDTEYCDTHGIAWKTAPGCNANSVEQYITSSLLMLSEKHNFNLKDKTIGIVGVGNVGSKVDIACRILGMKVLLNDPLREAIEKNNNHIKFTDIETIQREADFITFHTPLTKSGKYSTFHLANIEFLNNCLRKPFIINAARGGVTSNRALKSALKEEIISGVVLDCWENEPDIDLELLHMADIATPHIAGYSADGKWTATKMSIENLKNFFNLPTIPVYRKIPLPLQPIIDLKNIPEVKQLFHAVRHTYSPTEETKELKKSPQNFYQFRSKYPLRREYKAHFVENASEAVLVILKRLGFTEK